MRTALVAELQGRDLLRRRTVMALLVLLPAAFYYSIPASEDWGILAGSIGVSWAVAAAGLFGMLGWHRADPRLALAGAPAAQGMLGRLLLLHALALLLVAVFTPQILWRSAALIDEPAVMVLALVLMALVSVPLGLAIGGLVARELEGTLLLIGVVGVGMSVPIDTALARVLPLWGPMDLMAVSAGMSTAGSGRGIAHAIGTATVLLAVASWSWRRRVRIRPGS